MSASFSPSATNESGEEINGTPAPEEETSDKNTQQDVLVIPFGPIIGESVGLLSEQKVRTCANTVGYMSLFRILLIVYLVKLYMLHTVYIKLYH